MPEGFDPDAFARTFGGGRAAGARRRRVRGDVRPRRHLRQPVRRRRRRRGGRPAAAASAPRSARRRRDRSARRDASPRRRWARERTRPHRRRRRRSRCKIPPGVETGGRLRVPGRARRRRARRRRPAISTSDIEVRPDRYLRRNGDDIELDLPVTFAEAALGAKVEVPTVEGRVTRHSPAGHVERRAAAAARARRQDSRTARAAIRSVAVEIVVAEDRARRRRDAKAVRGDRSAHRSVAQTTLDASHSCSILLYLFQRPRHQIRGNAHR